MLANTLVSFGLAVGFWATFVAIVHYYPGAFLSVVLAAIALFILVMTTAFISRCVVGPIYDLLLKRKNRRPL